MLYLINRSTRLVSDCFEPTPNKYGTGKVVPFVDAGTAWNNSGRTNPDKNTLVSLGLGLHLQLSARLTARLDWGIPLVDLSTRKRTLQENGLYFSVVSSPF